MCPLWKPQVLGHDTELDRKVALKFLSKESKLPARRRHSTGARAQLDTVINSER